MCSSTPNCKLNPYNGTNKVDRPLVDAPDKLSLALEPEAAGLFCQNSGKHHKKPKHFTVLDIGGGTVDITSYCIDDKGRICMVDQASGNDWGGIKVNEKFAQFLETLVGDPGFKQYISVPDPQLQQQHKADLNKLIYGEFEEQKVAFGDEEDTQKPAVINIPQSFLKFYKPEKLNAAIVSRHKDVAELDRSELTIEPRKMKEFFEDTVKHMCRIAFLALERVKVKEKLEAVYLVGGFGSCNFIKKIVQDNLQEQLGTELDVFVPINQKLAVVCGAIIFRRNPEIIWARTAEATYGDVVTIPFDADIHDPAYKIFDERGEEHCKNLFHPFTEIGDTICADEVLQDSVVPFESNQANMCFTIFSSDKQRAKDIWYVRDENNEITDGLEAIGTLHFDLQSIPGESISDKCVTLTFDLSQTEIQLKAHHDKTGKEVKVVLDTLTQRSTVTDTVEEKRTQKRVLPG